jgi:uncharacterized protein (DUF302 family)
VKTTTLWLGALLLLLTQAVQAENMVMRRVDHGFETSMILLKDKLEEYGYRVAHIQKCDGGLGDFGYQTDKYRLVFFGKLQEVRQLSNRHPELIPFLPLKIAVIKEQESVVLVALNPRTLSEFFPGRELDIQFQRWESDIRAIFSEIGATERL